MLQPHTASPQAGTAPLVHYYQAYFHHQLGQVRRVPTEAVSECTVAGPTSGPARGDVHAHSDQLLRPCGCPPAHQPVHCPLPPHPGRSSKRGSAWRQALLCPPITSSPLACKSWPSCGLQLIMRRRMPGALLCASLEP